MLPQTSDSFCQNIVRQLQMRNSCNCFHAVMYMKSLLRRRHPPDLPSGFTTAEFAVNVYLVEVIQRRRESNSLSGLSDVNKTGSESSTVSKHMTRDSVKVAPVLSETTQLRRSNRYPIEKRISRHTLTSNPVS